MHTKKTRRMVSLLRSWLTAAVGELLTCEGEPKNAVGTYCGSKDRQFIGH